MIRCTRAILYKDNLKYNLQAIRNYVEPSTKLCLAVKADAYGHNAVLASKIAEEIGIDYLAIATVDEGIELRNAGIKANLLLLSLAIPQEFTEIFDYGITPLIFGEDYINLFIDAAKKYFKSPESYPVYLPIDTGMGRIGAYPQEAGIQAKIINDSNYLKLEGMITHFCVSDSISPENQEFTKIQFERFKEAVENVKAQNINPGILSCGASAALLNNTDMHFDMVRPGIIAYGYYPDQVTKEYLQSKNKSFDIKPVMALETQVVAIRHFKKGQSISYGRTYVCQEDTDIAVLPIGYADGLLRRFSPGLEVTINGKNYPVRGRICMDQCMVEIGKDNKDIKLFDKVYIFGPKESGANQSAEVLAQIGNTITYEIFTSLSKRVERVIL